MGQLSLDAIPHTFVLSENTEAIWTNLENKEELLIISELSD
jgi:hypothetical protein